MKENKNENRIWIVPDNDLEAKAIKELLEKQGEEVLVTKQQWGASWDGLEEDIKSQLEKRIEEKSKEITVREEIPQEEYTMETIGEWTGTDWNQETKTGTRAEYLLEPRTEVYEYPGNAQGPGSTIVRKRGEFHAYREAMKIVPPEVYGVELQGESPYNDIDHHIYGEDDRSNPKASIEQVADILGVKLSLDELFIAANDKGHIHAMQELGKELGMTEKEIKEVVDNIRMRDRLAQGVTMDQENQAQEAVEKLGDITEKQALISINLPHSKTSTITDRLYGKYENLLITSTDGETNFYGTTEIINMLNDKFKSVDENGKSNCWSGGQLEQGSGFWGGYVDQEAIKEAVEEFVREQQKEKREENIEKSETIEKSHITNYSNGEEHKRSADYVKRKQNMEEKDVNNLDTVKDIMSREEKLFDEAVKNGDYNFDLGESYTREEKERKEYLNKILKVTTRLKFLSKDCKRLDSFAANCMITSAKQIEDLIVKNLLEVNFNQLVYDWDGLNFFGEFSELHKQTLLKSKYNPHRFLEQYKKLYDNYSEQFDEIPDEEKVRIKEVIHEKYNGVNFIPSPEDIIEKINSRIEKVMIDNNVGIQPEHKERLRGSYALTTYMKPRQIVGIEHSIKHAINEYAVKEGENEATLKGKERNLQYNYSVAISAKEKTDRPLTEICKEVLHEEPLFEEPKKEKESKSLIEKDKVKGFSFASIKQAIDKALGRDEHYR